MDGRRSGAAGERRPDRAGDGSEPVHDWERVPYCLTMLSDGTKAKEVEDDISTLDIAEILEKAVINTKERDIVVT